MNNVIKFPATQRQQRGEVLREIEVRPGEVRLVTTTPDGVRVTEILTPEEAAEWADEVRDAAADAMARRAP